MPSHYGTPIRRGRTPGGVAEYNPFSGITLSEEKYPIPGPSYVVPETLVHELTHAQQRARLGAPAYLFHLLLNKALTAARGRNPDTETPFEREAYAAQERARQRQEAQQADRRRLYQEQASRRVGL